MRPFPDEPSLARQKQNGTKKAPFSFWLRGRVLCALCPLPTERRARVTHLAAQKIFL
jgi:hypothetical protein